MKKTKKILLGTGIILVAVLTVSYFLNQSLEVEAVKIEPKEVTDTFTEQGVVRKGENMNVISKVSGDITELCVTKNSYVEKGSIIAKIEAKDYLYQKSMHQNTIESYKAQITETLSNEKYNKKDIEYNIEELNVQLDHLKSNKQQGQIGKITGDSPEEYIEALKLSLNTAQSDYDYCKAIYDSQIKLYNINAISKNELDTAENNYRKAENNLRQVQIKYNQSNARLTELKDLGISGDNLNEKFYEGQDADVDSAINTAEIQIADLQSKMQNDYSTDVVNRLNALIQNENVAMDQIEGQIKNCVIVAAVSGYIVDLPAESLSAIQANQTVAIIKLDHQFLVSVDVLTNAEPYLKAGDIVKITQKLKSEDHVFNGVIKEIYNFAAESTSALGLKEHRARVDVEVMDEEALLKDGYEVNVEFKIYNKADALSVPNSAIFKIDNTNYVFKEEKNRQC